LLDTGGIPLGERALQRILDHVVAVGDEAETNYLEVKSHLDLCAKVSVAKVAKFLLGMANRDPQAASRHFQGYGVLVIGAQKGEIRGIARGTEAHELEGRLRPYLGPEFPSFEFGRLPIDDDNEVLFVIAPPLQDGQPPFPCHKDFQGGQVKDNLADGAIYVRGASDTRPAKAGEIAALVKRARGAGKTPISLDIEILGLINRVTRVDEVMAKLYDLEEERFARYKPATTPRQSLANVLSGRLPMTAEEREAELVRWKRERPRRLRNGRDYFLGVSLPAAGIRVVSRDRFVSTPQLIVTFHGCEAVAHRDAQRADWSKVVEPVVRPQPFGLDLSSNDDLALARLRGYPVAWNNRSDDVVVELTPESFRPNVPWESDRDDYAVIARNPHAASVKVTWVLTEEQSDVTTTGELTLDTSNLIDAADLVARRFKRPD